MMNASEHRQLGRDSLFLLADLRQDGVEADHRIKVRNLSAGGMMGEGLIRVHRGMLVSINIRNIGWVEGTVAWVHESRFGVAFRDEIDPKVARASLAADGDHTPRHLRLSEAFATPRTSVLRKI